VAPPSEQPPRSPSPAQRIGRYELVSALGRGGAGQVWEAVLLGPRGFRKPVALKVVHAGLDMRSPQGQSLVQEARLGALLSHPNVVGIYELGEAQDGQLYVAMELVRGPSVLAMIREGPLGPAAILDVGMQACAGLQHIHQLEVEGQRAGLVHRDVKPSNLLVDESGLVKIADLGVARLTGQREELIAGTPGYMSPEQMEGEEDHRTDVFGLGATLYVLAAGTRPFGGGTPALRRVMRVEHHLAKPEFLAPVEAKVPGLGPIVARCLRYDPDERWPSAAALGEALGQLRADRSGPGLRQRLRGEGPASLPPAGPPPLARLDDSTEVTDERARVSLPEAAGELFGRDEALRSLLAALGRTRMVSLEGPAGCGKSRLALELAHRLEERGHQVWFVDVGGGTSPSDLYRAVATALDVPLDAEEPVQRLGHALRALGRATVVLDNVEGVVDVVATAIASWAARSSNLRFVATSRRPPKVPGAHQVVLGGLDPEAAAALFMARAPAPPDAADRPRVLGLVKRLDGLPLAVELAAARTRVARLDQILERLDLRMLAAGDGGRHRSLRASLDASFDRLPAAQQEALGQLSVFAGGFVLEAAEAVLDLSGHPGSPWALDVLDGLMDHSLVQLSAERGRFSLLHTVRAYARQRCDDRVVQAAGRRHAAFYAQLGSAASVASLHAEGGEERLADLARESANLEAAIDRALDLGVGGDAEGCALAMWEVLQLRGPLRDARTLLDRVVEARGSFASPRLLCAAGRAHTLTASADAARSLLERALYGARSAGDAATEADAAGNLGYLERDAGRIERAQGYFEASLAGYNLAGDRWGAGRALYRLGLLRYHQSRLVEARGLYESALRAFREVGDRRHEAGVLTSYALVLSDLGRGEEGIRRGEQGLAMHREVGNRHTEAVAMTNLGILYRRMGRLDQAYQLYQRAVASNRMIGNRRLEGALWGNIGTLLAERDDPQGALSAFDQALEAHREVGNRHYEGVVLGNYADVLLTLGDVQGARQRLGVALGVAVSVGDRAMEGAFLGVLGEVLEAQGDHEGADSTLAQAEQVLAEVGDHASLARVILRRVEVAMHRRDWAAAREALVEAAAACDVLPPTAGVRQRLRAMRAKLP